MTQEEIRKCKELMHELNALVKKYYNKCLKNPDEEYSDWRWSSEDPNKIIITYSFLNYLDEYDCDEYEVTFEELSNFKLNMKEYMLYITNASNHNNLITKDAKGNPFTKESAIEYGKQIRDNCVFLIEGKRTLIHA